MKDGSRYPTRVLSFNALNVLMAATAGPQSLVSARVSRAFLEGGPPNASIGASDQIILPLIFMSLSFR